VLASPFWPAAEYPAHRSGGFAASALPRFGDEITFWFRLDGYRERQRARLAATAAALPPGNAELSGLDRQHVLLFLIESYGETLLDRPLFAEKSSALYARLQGKLEQTGFHTASAILDSPTYGGGSWLAHATLATGIRVDSQLDYDLLSSSRPRTLPQRFHDAGYRTVVVQPGTTRALSKPDFLGFDHAYYAWSFGYRGPRFGWASMPDQYVVDWIRKKELETATQPLLLTFALVSSHAPWSTLPPLVDDWSKLGDGTIFNELTPVRAAVEWSDLARGSLAYQASIEYDLELLTRFLVDFVEDDSLVLWAGDHQPAPDVTGHSPKQGVPIHVISRRGAFLEPFFARGYTPGLKPARGAARLPMESLLVSLLRDFSKH
jgi:hypothetical protein